MRPRGDRAEITADFTPSPALMIATGTFLVGVVRDVMGWPTFEIDALDRADIPRIAAFEPIPHTSRSGWLAHAISFPANPFTTGVDVPRIGNRGQGTESQQLTVGSMRWRNQGRFVSVPVSCPLFPVPFSVSRAFKASSSFP
jgi:hypothetical protein